MEKNFYLFRHGETEFNRLQLVQGRKVNVCLNKTGREQAKMLAESLLPYHLEVIISSPLIRAAETAQIVAQRLKIPVKIFHDLIEGDFGCAEGMRADELQENWPEVIKNWNSPEHMDIAFPNGETEAAIQKRMVSAMNDFLLLPEQNIGISSHSSALRLFLATVGGDKVRVLNAKAIHVKWSDGQWRIV